LRAGGTTRPFEITAFLRTIYTAPTAEAAFDALAAFAASDWGRKSPQAVRVFENAWDVFDPFLAFIAYPGHLR